MNNISSYNEITAFHPGYYISEIIEDMNITQAEFATRMGTTPKTLSQLINAQANLSNDLAKKISTMLGNSIDFWLNLQKAYDEKVIEIQKAKEIDEQREVAKMIDYNYFVKVIKLPQTTSLAEKTKNLCGYLKVSDLRILTQQDLLVNFRTGVNHIEEKNLLNARIWLQTALNCAQNMQAKPFNASKLKEALPEIRTMTIQEPEIFLPRLCQIFAECGVVFVLLPYLKNSAINGAVKWVSSERVILAMNDRKLNADTFWFSLFHEIKHVLQQKIKTVFISSSIDKMHAIDKKLEDEADEFAQNYLIPLSEYRLFSPTKYTSDAQIRLFANKIGVHPGVVVGRLQHDGIIPQNRCSQLREKYKIII